MWGDSWEEATNNREKGTKRGTWGSLIRSCLERSERTAGHSEGWVLGVCRGRVMRVYVCLQGALNGARTADCLELAKQGQQGARG